MYIEIAFVASGAEGIKQTTKTLIHWMTEQDAELIDSQLVDAAGYWRQLYKVSDETAQAVCDRFKRQFDDFKIQLSDTNPWGQVGDPSWPSTENLKWNDER